MVRISVIIPTLNEAAYLRATLLRLEPQGVHEIIVADGGSRDDTLAISEALCGKVVHAKPGRANQMNAGAQVATGDVLVFLHGDTLLPPQGIAAIQDAMGEETCVGGAFTLHTDLKRLSMRLVEATINIRSRLLRWPYGDQGLFVRREVFEKLEGYRDLQIMEDIDFVRRLRKLGRLHILNQHVKTSGRRWAANGVLRTTLVNWTATAMYMCGRSPQKIRAFYDRWSSSQTRTTTRSSTDDPETSMSNVAITPKPAD